MTVAHCAPELTHACAAGRRQRLSTRNAPVRQQENTEKGGATPALFGAVRLGISADGGSPQRGAKEAKAAATPLHSSGLRPPSTSTLFTNVAPHEVPPTLRPEVHPDTRAALLASVRHREAERNCLMLGCCEHCAPNRADGVPAEVEELVHLTDSSFLQDRVPQRGGAIRFDEIMVADVLR